MEMPCEFNELIANARAKPSPFQVINVEEDPRIVRDWADFLKDTMYKKTCPFKIQEIRELYCSSQQSYIYHHSNYNGLYSKGIIIAAKKKVQPQRTQVTQSLCQDEELYLPNAAYERLEDVYNSMLAYVQSTIKKENIRFGALTTDLWTDQFRRHNYITCTIHYISHEMNLLKFTLATQKFTMKFKVFLLTFQIPQKDIVLVTDSGSNMKRAAD
ncbi:unnamed protein product [Colias eurytheme]|nr:unnamed protein product [Colias eurytheme]